MAGTKQTYKYKIENSIIYKGQDEYVLSKNEYYYPELFMEQYLN